MPFAENSMVGDELYGSDMFTCGRCHRRISKSDCLKRQGERVVMPVKNYWGSKTQPAFPECRGCIQGMQVRLERMMIG